MFRVPTVSELRFSAVAFWRRSATNKFVVVCTAVFLAQSLELFCAGTLTLNPIWARSGFLLNFLSYGFLHGGFWHFALNMLGLYFTGNALERTGVAGGNVSAVFLGGIAVGGLAWFALVAGAAAHPDAQTLVGASAGIFALLAYFSVVFRDLKISFLLFFVIPLRMRGWMLATALAGISLLCLLFFEMPPMRNGEAPSSLQLVAHSAHLGGALFGALFAFAEEFLRTRFLNVRYFRR